MSTILEIPIPKLQNTVVFDPPLTDEEFERMSMANELVKLERTKDGKIIVNPPTGFESGSGHGEIIFQLMNWWKQHRKGRVLDNNTGFFLPDGSSLSPDGGYITEAQFRGLTKKDREHFLRLTPAFVIELLSRSDSLPAVKEKMETWIANGAQLGWLVDPCRRSVLIYEAGQEAGKKPRVETGDEVTGSGPVEGFVLDLAAMWTLYED
jgi:Uma2 family endonuclease